MLVNDFMSAPTSSVRAPSAVTSGCCDKNSPMRLTARPMSQRIQAPPTIASSVKHLTLGQVLEMTSDDPASEADMRSWAARTGHELLEIEKNGTVFRFFVRKTR